MKARLGIIASYMVMGVSSFHCATTQREFETQHWDESVGGPIPSYAATVIEVLRTEMLPDSGVYYIYRSPDNGADIGNVENKLRRLYVLGIDVSMAWYRPSRGGCEKPGTDAITTTIYPEYFLLHLDTQNYQLRRYSFYEIPRPASLPCPYRFSVYTPRRP